MNANKIAQVVGLPLVGFVAAYVLSPSHGPVQRVNSIRRATRTAPTIVSRILDQGLWPNKRTKFVLNDKAPNKSPARWDPCTKLTAQIYGSPDDISVLQPPVSEASRAVEAVTGLSIEVTSVIGTPPNNRDAIADRTVVVFRDEARSTLLVDNRDHRFGTVVDSRAVGPRLSNAVIAISSEVSLVGVLVDFAVSLGLQLVTYGPGFQASSYVHVDGRGWATQLVSYENDRRRARLGYGDLTGLAQLYSDRSCLP